MIRRPPRSTRTDTLFPYTTLCRSDGGAHPGDESREVGCRADPFRDAPSARAGWNGRDLAEAERQPLRPGLRPRRPAAVPEAWDQRAQQRSEEHTSELQSLMRISYAVFCLKKKTQINNTIIKI